MSVNEEEVMLTPGTFGRLLTEMLYLKHERSTRGEEVRDRSFFAAKLKERIYAHDETNEAALQEEKKIFSYCQDNWSKNIEKCDYEDNYKNYIWLGDGNSGTRHYIYSQPLFADGSKDINEHSRQQHWARIEEVKKLFEKEPNKTSVRFLLPVLREGWTGLLGEKHEDHIVLWIGESNESGHLILTEIDSKSSSRAPIPNFELTQIGLGFQPLTDAKSCGFWALKFVEFCVDNPLFRMTSKKENIQEKMQEQKSYSILKSDDAIFSFSRNTRKKKIKKEEEKEKGTSEFIEIEEKDLMDLESQIKEKLELELKSDNEKEFHGWENIDENNENSEPFNKLSKNKEDTEIEFFLSELKGNLYLVTEDNEGSGKFVKEFRQNIDGTAEQGESFNGRIEFRAFNPILNERKKEKYFIPFKMSEFLFPFFLNEAQEKDIKKENGFYLFGGGINALKKAGSERDALSQKTTESVRHILIKMIEKIGKMEDQESFSKAVFDQLCSKADLLKRRSLSSAEKKEFYRSISEAIFSFIADELVLISYNKLPGFISFKTSNRIENFKKTELPKIIDEILNDFLRETPEPSSDKSDPHFPSNSEASSGGPSSEGEIFSSDEDEKYDDRAESPNKKDIPVLILTPPFKKPEPFLRPAAVIGPVADAVPIKIEEVPQDHSARLEEIHSNASSAVASSKREDEKHDELEPHTPEVVIEPIANADQAKQKKGNRKKSYQHDDFHGVRRLFSKQINQDDDLDVDGVNELFPKTSHEEEKEEKNHPEQHVPAPNDEQKRNNQEQNKPVPTPSHVPVPPRSPVPKPDNDQKKDNREKQHANNPNSPRVPVQVEVNVEEQDFIDEEEAIESGKCTIGWGFAVGIVTLGFYLGTVFNGLILAPWVLPALLVLTTALLVIGTALWLANRERPSRGGCCSYFSLFKTKPSMINENEKSMADDDYVIVDFRNYPRT